MLRKLIRFSLRQRLVVLGAVALIIVWGVRSFVDIPIEAFPDVQDVQVQVITPWVGHAAEEVEKVVTLPIERAMNGTPGLTNLRSVSIFGLSVVTMTFEDGTQDYFARQQVLERLQTASVPAGVQPGLAPLTNALGEIYRYTVAGDLPLIELKAIEDWVVEPAYRTVPGVVDVSSFGGAVKQYQVDVDPMRLQAYKLTLAQVEDAVASANANSGGGYIEHGAEKQVIRGVALFQSARDIEDVAITARSGTPVRVRDIGTVHVGPAPREGYVAKDSADDVVQGIVLMRKGENATEVLKRVRAKTELINATLLPRGVQVVPFYDRSALVKRTTDTVEENLLVGATLVLVVLVAFLGQWRGALIVATVIPVSLLAAFILMEANKVAANLVSLGAVDFGLIVDAAVVMVEAFVVALAHHAPSPNASPERSSLERRTMLAEVTEAMGRPMLFSVTCVVTAFLPIFTFQRVERRIFSPMAYTLTFTLLASLLYSLTVIPVLASWFMKAGGDHGETWITRQLHRIYLPCRDWVLARSRAVLAGAVVVLLIALGLGTRLGTEFLPSLDEGNIWLTVTMPVAIAPKEAIALERKVRSVLMGYPQVTRVVTQIGRPDDGTDPKGINNLEVLANLKPRTELAPFHEKDELVDDMARQLGAIPGLQLNFSQYIKDNVEEALSGVKGEVAIKIFGPDLTVLQEKGEEVRRVLAGVPGVADLGIENQFGQPQLRVEMDRDGIGRQGLRAADVNDVVETAIGGRAVTQFLEGNRVFDVRLRFSGGQRDNRQGLADLPVNTPDGRLVPLGSLASLSTVEGASRISREANERRIAIKCSVRGRDQGGFVAEAQRQVDARVTLPPGYRITWGGQFENQRRAQARLEVIVPASLILIFVLLFSAFGSTKYALLILGNLPFALIGGIVTLWVRGIHLSVSAAVGFVALFGIAVQNGILLVTEFNRLREAGHPVGEAVRMGTENRLRPVTMTALMAAIGLLPAALSHGVGAETTRPFASVIVGGLASATILTLLLLPALYVMFHEDPKEDIPA